MGNGTDSAWHCDDVVRTYGNVAADVGLQVGHAMADLFTILSTPVRMRDGTFAVVIGTIAGIVVKEFATLREAKTHYRMLVACLRMAVEAPLELVLIDDETEYPPLRKRFDEEFKRRVHPRPPVRPVAQVMPDSPFRKLVTRVAGFLT